MGEGELICCQVPMENLNCFVEGTGQEKHKPVLQKKEEQILVKVGEIPHPMEEEHSIQWIEVQADDKVFRKELSPGDQPQVLFELGTEKIEKSTVRSYCNIHGLWKS
jgi:superoxide reductase